MSRVSISVALCTYNGERYLAEQLASISRQTRLPDELVVCDDASTDGSVRILKNFAKHVAFPVSVHVNSTNVRSTKNFESAIRLCKGDIILLADQDDVWLPKKIERLVGFLSANPSKGFVFSDAICVDHNRRPLGYSLWQAVDFTAHVRRGCQNRGLYFYLLKRYCVTGATMGFRSRFRNAVLPIPPSWVHDAWIAFIIAAIADGGFVEEPLIEYRQHNAQQIGGRPHSLLQQYRIARSLTPSSYQKVIEDFTLARERLTQSTVVAGDKRESLEQKLKHFDARCSMRSCGKWRLPAVIREAITGRYSRYSLGWKSMCQDLFLA